MRQSLTTTRPLLLPMPPATTAMRKSWTWSCSFVIMIIIIFFGPPRFSVLVSRFSFFCVPNALFKHCLFAYISSSSVLPWSWRWKLEFLFLLFFLNEKGMRQEPHANSFLFSLASSSSFSFRRGFESVWTAPRHSSRGHTRTTGLLRVPLVEELVTAAPVDCIHLCVYACCVLMKATSLEQIEDAKQEFSYCALERRGLEELMHDVPFE